MANDKRPITIKKYANRRLYNTSTSAYVTLEDLAIMVKAAMIRRLRRQERRRHYPVGADADYFRTGRQRRPEPAADHILAPTHRFYGDSMQMLVPSYLEFTIDKLTSEQGRSATRSPPASALP